MKAKTVVISVRLPKETLDAVDELARRHQRSRSWIVNEALKIYIQLCEARDAGDGSAS